jgi:hypothetical protein
MICSLSAGRPIGRREESMTKVRPAERLRPPVFVDRETGAAELCVSTETWDAMVLTGELPPATVHLRTRLPRWRWSVIERWLDGDRRPPSQDESAEAPPPESPFVAALRVRNDNGPKAKGRG